MKPNRQPEAQSRDRRVRPRRFLRDNKAVSALEYAILVGVVAVGIGTALTAFNTEITTALKNAGDSIKSIAGVGPSTP